MHAEPEWVLVRRIALIAESSPGRGIARDVLLARLGMSWVDLKPSAMLAYKRGRIDFVRDYVVAPARKSLPKPDISGAISGDISRTPSTVAAPATMLGGDERGTQP